MIRCDRCGFENDSTMNFCLNCGNPLNTFPSQSSAAKTEVLSVNPSGTPTVVLPKKKSNKKFWIVGGLFSLLILGFLGVGGIWLAKSFVGSDNTNRKSLTPVSSPKKSAAATPEKSSPTPDVSNTSTPDNNSNLATPEISEPLSPNATFTPPTKPTSDAVFKVKANEGWQLTNIDVVGNGKFVLLAMGAVDLKGIGESITPKGINDKKFESRRIYKEFTTGALLMRTRYPDGKFSKISDVGGKDSTGIWTTDANEFGKLEFCINDNSPEGNSGEHIITFGAINNND